MTCLDMPKAELPSARKLFNMEAARFGKCERVWAESVSLPHIFLNFLGGLASFSFLGKKHFFTLVLLFLFLPPNHAIMEAWLIKIAPKKM